MPGRRCTKWPDGAGSSKVSGPESVIRSLPQRYLGESPVLDFKKYLSFLIFRSCYEFFKYLLHTWGADNEPPGEDTLEDLRREQERQARLAASQEDGRAQKDSRFWESLEAIRVSDLPRPQALAESRVSSSELVQDRTFPGYRT